MHVVGIDEAIISLSYVICLNRYLFILFVMKLYCTLPCIIILSNCTLSFSCNFLPFLVNK